MKSKVIEVSKDTRMLLNYRRLKDIKRCNNFHKIISEDVAQHSWYVTILAMNIADEYNANKGARFASIDTALVMRKALLHDTDECFTSDIPYNIKHSNPHTHEVIEKALLDRMEKAYEGTSVIVQDYKIQARHCKDGDCGYIIGIADMLELAVYCYEEVTMGNTWMKTLLTKAVRLVKQLIDIQPASMDDITSMCPTLMNLLAVVSSETSYDSVICETLDID